MEMDTWVTCPECGVDLKSRNLHRHISKVHPHAPLKTPSKDHYFFSKHFKLVMGLFLIILIISGSIGTVIYLDYFECENEDEEELLIDDNGKNDGFEEKVETVNQKAIDWLDTLDVDPIRLRDEMGIKGKKKLVELLDTYFCLYRTTECIEKRTYYREKVANATQVTYTPEYHDMDRIDDQQFNQDSTSYLRAYCIIDELGLDTTYYLKNIEKVLPRLDSHLSQRGTNQKMAFVLYYKHLRFDINYTMEGLFPHSVIRSAKSIDELSDMEVYYITHEILFLYDDDAMHILNNKDTEYLNEILPGLMEKHIEKNNVDLLAELIMVLTYLKYDHLDIYDIAIDFLLNSQNENGSFGDYEYEREHCEKQGLVFDVDYLLYLHTTEVSLIALNEAL